MFKAALFLARISVSTQNTAGEIAFQFSLFFFFFKNPKEEKRKEERVLKVEERWRTQKRSGENAWFSPRFTQINFK